MWPVSASRSYLFREPGRHLDEATTSVTGAPTAPEQRAPPPPAAIATPSSARSGARRAPTPSASAPSAATATSHEPGRHQADAHPSDAIRSSRSSRNASASTARRRGRSARRSVRRQRSTTVRPRLSSDSGSTSTLRCSVVDEPGPEHVGERDRVVDRRAVPAVRAPVVALEELDEVGDERADAAGGAEALGPRRRQERAGG